MAQSLELNIKTTSDVPAAMDKATRATTSFGRSVDSVKGKATGAFGGIAGKLTSMFGAAVLFDRALGFISKTFSEFGKVADQVDRSGISAEDFQRLAYAAEQSGVSVTALAKATRQLRVEMANAAGGDEKKLKMFQALGLSMEQLKAGDASAAFLAISAALSGSADESERLLIATTFFGDKIGNDILPLLGDYARLSKDMSEAPVINAKTLKAIGDADDGLQRLSNTFKVLIANIVRAYDEYSKFAEKVAGGIAGVAFKVYEKIGLGDVAPKVAQGLLKNNQITGSLVAAGADGSVSRSSSTSSEPTVANKEAAAKILSAIKNANPMASEDAAKAKGANFKGPEGYGNVIGVGSNIAIEMAQMQIDELKRHTELLQMIAAKNVTSPDFSKGDKPSSSPVGAKVLSGK